MDHLVMEITKATIEILPDAPREVLREVIAENMAKVLVERALGEFERRAVEQTRAELLPTVDVAINEALAAVDNEADETWEEFTKSCVALGKAETPE
jgi:hypothetical protein